MCVLRICSRNSFSHDDLVDLMDPPLRAIPADGFDFGVSAAFMMQTLDRNPLFGIIAVLGFLNLVAAAFVVLFLHHVPFTAIPKSARMLVASFLLYFMIS